MHPESVDKKLKYKLRELELIIRQIDFDQEPSRIDIDLALEKTRQLYNILITIGSGPGQEPAGVRPRPRHSHPVVSADPDPDEDNSLYESESIIPTPLHHDQPEKKQIPEERAAPGHEKTEPVKKEEDAGRSEKKEDAAGDKIGEVPGQEPSGGEKRKTQEPPADEGREKKNKSPEAGIVADKYQSPQSYINQAIADKQGKKDLTSKLQARPISDLRSSIGLNDKFLFIKEIFRGRPDRYSQCIDDLNKASSYEEAFEILKDKYSLDLEGEVPEKLLALVKRRHQSE